MILQALIDLIYPPLCLFCKEECKTRFLCPECWQLCQSMDPNERCLHCFEEKDQIGSFCSQCRKKPRLPIPRAYSFDAASPARVLGLDSADAMAGFAFLQWIQLEWPSPDAIIPMPDTSSIAIGKALSFLIDCPFVRALAFDCQYKTDRLEEGQTLLLFDVFNPIEKLSQAALCLSESFPKRIYLLSLYG